MTGAQLDKEAEELIRDHGAVPGFKGLYGCPSTLLISINEQVVTDYHPPNLLRTEISFPLIVEHLSMNITVMQLILLHWVISMKK